MSGKPQPNSERSRRRERRELLAMRRALQDLGQSLVAQGITFRMGRRMKPILTEQGCNACLQVKPIGEFGLTGVTKRNRRKTCNTCRAKVWVR
jgi:hypothetical protein